MRLFVILRPASVAERSQYKKAPPPARRGVKGVQRMFIQAVILLRPAFQFFPQDA